MDQGMKVTVIVPVYDRPDLLMTCLESLAEQDMGFDVVVVDDASPESDAMRACQSFLFDTFPWRCWVKHPQNLGSLRSIRDGVAVSRAEPDDVILLVDGDDRLDGPTAVSTLYDAYDLTGALFAYGSYRPDPPEDGCPPATRIPHSVLVDGTIRSYITTMGIIPFNHPLSFRRRVLDAIDDTELQIDGEWMRYGYDIALAVPAIELAGDRVVFMTDCLYVYTSNRDDSVARARPTETHVEGQHVLHRPRVHTPLEWT